MPELGSLVVGFVLNVVAGLSADAAVDAVRRLAVRRDSLAQQLVEELQCAFRESVKQILEGWQPARGGGVLAQAEAPAVQSALQALEELSLAPRAPVERLAEIFHQPDYLKRELVKVLLALLRPHWPQGLPPELETAVRERWLEGFRERVRERIARNQAVANYVDQLHHELILDRLGVIQEGLSIPRRTPPAEPERLVNLPDLSQRIYGRDREANLVLKALLGNERAVAIIAPPLFGKTALLVRVLQLVTDGRELRAPGLNAIAVLNCRDVARDLAAMARELGRLRGESWEEVARAQLLPREKAHEVWKGLDPVRRAWIVLENFEELLEAPGNPEVREQEVRAFVEMFFERQSAHKLLVLSRYMPRLPGLRPFAEIAEGLRRGLQPEQAVALLRTEGNDCGFDRAPESVLHELAARLHFMPFGLRLAVEFVRYRSAECTPQSLLERPEFEAFRNEELEPRFARILRGLLESLSQQAQRLLRWLAFLPAPLPRTALEALAEDGRLQVTLVALHNSVLIESERDLAGENWYRLHASVREVIREDARPWWEEIGEEGARRLLKASNVAYRQRRYPVAEALLHSAERVLRALVAAGREDLKEDLATALMNRANTLASLERYVEALAGYDEALGIRRALVAAGREDLKEDLATAAMGRAVTLHALKRYEEALAGYDEALAIWSELVAAGREDLREDLARALANKHVLLEAMGRLPEALELIEEAIRIRKELVREGYEHVREKLLTAFQWKAMTLEALGRPEDVARCRQEAAEWRRA